MLKYYKSDDILECGIDEVARGCIFGRVYSACVIWNPKLEIDENVKITDSKRCQWYKTTQYSSHPARSRSKCLR